MRFGANEGYIGVAGFEKILGDLEAFLYASSSAESFDALYKDFCHTHDMNKMQAALLYNIFYGELHHPSARFPDFSEKEVQTSKYNFDHLCFHLISKPEAIDIAKICLFSQTNAQRLLSYAVDHTFLKPELASDIAALCIDAGADPYGENLRMDNIKGTPNSLLLDAICNADRASKMNETYGIFGAEYNLLRVLLSKGMDLQAPVVFNNYKDEPISMPSIDYASMRAQSRPETIDWLKKEAATPTPPLSLEQTLYVKNQKTKKKVEIMPDLWANSRKMLANEYALTHAISVSNIEEIARLLNCTSIKKQHIDQAIEMKNPAVMELLKNTLAMQIAQPDHLARLDNAPIQSKKLGSVQYNFN